MAHFDTEHLDRIGNRRQWIAGILAVVLLGVGLFAIIREEQLRAQLERERNQAEVTADQLCEQVKRLGRTCEVAPPPLRGEAGRGIRAARTAGDCHILITYTDGTSHRVGPFCRTAGKSITAVARDGCDLIISFSDGTSSRTGPWCMPGPKGDTGETGPAGRGLADVDCVGEGKDSHWIITYTDGTAKTIDKQCDVRNAPPLPEPTIT